MSSEHGCAPEMDQWVASLNGKEDFLVKVSNAQNILFDAQYVFPGKMQILMDWLLNSLVKIGKFDESNM